MLGAALLLQADSATQKQLDLVRMTENSKRTLEQEVSAYRFVELFHGAGHIPALPLDFSTVTAAPMVPYKAALDMRQHQRPCWLCAACSPAAAAPAWCHRGPAQCQAAEPCISASCPAELRPRLLPRSFCSLRRSGTSTASRLERPTRGTCRCAAHWGAARLPQAAA